MKNMKTTSHEDEPIAKMIFASVYPHYLTKVSVDSSTKWSENYKSKKPQIGQRSKSGGGKPVN